MILGNFESPALSFSACISNNDIIIPFPSPGPDDEIDAEMAASRDRHHA